MDPNKENAPIRVNYVYFGLFLGALLFTSACSMILKENMLGSRFFFLIYALGQAVMETLLFIFTGWLVRQLLGKLCFWFFIGGSFVIAVVHVIDFMLDRVLDMSIIHTTAFIYDESFQNLLYLIDASGVPRIFWAFFLGFLFSLPFLGMAVYKGSDWLPKRKPLFIRQEVFLQAFVCIPAALLFWDFSASRMIHPDAYTTFRKSLPWKQTFFYPKSVVLKSGKLTPQQNERDIVKMIGETEITLADKPSIFLFVTESLRADFITQDTAPNLSRFRDENIHGDISLSNANGTMISWFSIFHSQFPYLWNKTKKTGWKTGSPALALLKKLGYKIRVYTAAELEYYGMKQLIFGENHHLADSFQTFEHTAPKPACLADKNAINTLENDLSKDPSLRKGHVFVIFLDSTHFDYSWPKDKPSKFTPFGSEVSYFQAYQSEKNIGFIKNRYRNAINYVDSLFGEFLKIVPSDAFIVFTGDHGEEFFDQGHLFHNSHISKSQTSIPIFMKIKGQKKTVPLLSQMDIMPTLLDGVCGTTFPFLQGESALRDRQWPFVAIARFNAGRCPYEWCLHDGKTKLILQFENRKNILESEKVHILSLRTNQDLSFSDYKKEPLTWVEDHFGRAFDRLFMRE